MKIGDGSQFSKNAIRCFFAVPVSEENKLFVKARADALKKYFSAGKASWTKEKNFHLTLWFLGDVPEKLIEKIIQRAEPVLAALPPFDFHVGYAGAFPSSKKPKVLWLAPDEGAEHFIALRRGLEEALSSLPVKRENKKFFPHLTLGRVRALSPDFQEAPPLSFHFTQRVTEVVLYKSKLHPSGSVHTALKTFPLTNFIP